MSPCCGRPNNNAAKGEAGYYARYAFLNSAQRAKQLKMSGSSCSTCTAITMGDPCSVCGNPKSAEEEQGE